MNTFNKVTRIHGGAVIYNYDLKPLEKETAGTENRPHNIPHAVFNARNFPTMKDAVTYLRAQGCKNPTVIKAAKDKTAHNGTDERRVPENALYGHFPDKTPFIITDMRVYGSGAGAHFKAIRQVRKVNKYDKVLWDYPDYSAEATIEKPSKNHTLYMKQAAGGLERTTEKQADFVYHAYSVEPIELTEDVWVKFDLPLSCTVGQFAYWYTLLNPPAVIPLKDENTIKNGTIKFNDKRPNTHKDKAPDGIKTGSTITQGPHYKPSTKTQVLYSVRYYDKYTDSYVWKTQNESQVNALAREHKTTVSALIEAGEVIAK